MKEWSQFEKTIENTNEWYRSKGLGVVSKIPNGTKTISCYGRPRTILTDKTGCDFQGHLEGHPIAFDCKSTANKTSFPLFTHDKPMVKTHQMQYLLDFKKTGGSAFLMIQFNPIHGVFLIDIESYFKLESEALNHGHKSIPAGAFGGCEVQERGYYLDYLKNVEKQFNHEG